MTDAEVLALAAEGQRVPVSHDVGTMPAQFRAFRKAGKSSSGYFSSRRVWMSQLQSMNFCWSTLHRKHRIGKPVGVAAFLRSLQDRRYFQTNRANSRSLRT
jgi:hypothetical protein